MHCRICGKKSSKTNICKTCNYFLKQGNDEGTIKAMYSDDKTKKIWKENEKIAEDLADTYYDSVLENYKTPQVKKDSKENLGYNTFIDGIKIGLDIIMPMLSEEMRKEVKEKVIEMIISRNIKNELSKYKNVKK